MPVPSLIATYRVVRPMFLGGPDQSPELRAASFKGLLRFWWRAAAWERVGRSLAKLRESEATIFGSMAYGQGALRLRLIPPNRVNLGSAAQWIPNSWQNYTAYGLKDAGRSPISHGLTIAAVLTARHDEVLTDRNLSEALKLLGLCGGLGARSRNGWGSLTLVSLQGAGTWEAPRTTNSLRSEISSLLSRTASAIKEPPPYTAITAEARFTIGVPCQTAEEAHKAMAECYKSAVTGARKEDRGQFGLPRRRDAPLRRVGSGATGACSSDERRAKPLFMHVHQVDSDSKALPVALYLPSVFTEAESSIPGGGTAILNFLNTLERQNP